MVEKQLQPKYDSKTNTIIQESNGLIQWLDPKTKKVLHEKYTDTNEEIFYEYDDNGNRIHYKAAVRQKQKNGIGMMKMVNLLAANAEIILGIILMKMETFFKEQIQGGN